MEASRAIQFAISGNDKSRSRLTAKSLLGMITTTTSDVNTIPSVAHLGVMRDCKYLSHGLESVLGCLYFSAFGGTWHPGTQIGAGS
jgi:hypothetical protein